MEEKRELWHDSGGSDQVGLEDHANNTNKIIKCKAYLDPNNDDGFVFLQYSPKTSEDILKGDLVEIRSGSLSKLVLGQCSRDIKRFITDGNNISKRGGDKTEEFRRLQDYVRLEFYYSESPQFLWMGWSMDK